MRRLVSGWAESASAVGGALLRVWKAEAEALKRDLTRSGNELRGAVVLLALAAGVAFWTIGLGLWTAVETLAAYLPRWGAAAAVCGAGLVIAVTLLLLGRRRLRKVESPLGLVRRRGREHAEWWQDTMASRSPKGARKTAAAERSERRPAGPSDRDDDLGAG